MNRCIYCGRFVKVKDVGVECEISYGFMSADYVYYYHDKCQEARIKSENLSNNNAINQITGGKPMSHKGKAEELDVFICKSCNHCLPIEFNVRTEGFCYLCDPHITLEECLSDEPLRRNPELLKS